MCVIVFVCVYVWVLLHIHTYIYIFKDIQIHICPYKFGSLNSLSDEEYYQQCYSTFSCNCANFQEA